MVFIQAGLMNPGKGHEGRNHVKYLQHQSWPRGLYDNFIVTTTKCYFIYFSCHWSFDV